MRPELDAKLCADFPLLYRMRNASPRVSSMRYGFPNDGWEPLIRALSEKLEKLIELEPEDPDLGRPYAVQVKEKFGALRFYMSHSTDEMQDLISKAESLSYETCEECGEPGEIIQSGYLRCLCPSHRGAAKEE